MHYESLEITTVISLNFQTDRSGYISISLHKGQLDDLQILLLYILFQIISVISGGDDEGFCAMKC